MRRSLPDRIANAPELHLGLELYWDAFWDLSSCRTSGFGAGPIPWLAIREYAVTFELDEEQQDDLFYLVRRMDNVYLEHHRKNQKDS